MVTMPETLGGTNIPEIAPDEARISDRRVSQALQDLPRPRKDYTHITQDKILKEDCQFAIDTLSEVPSNLITTYSSTDSPFRVLSRDHGSFRARNLAKVLLAQSCLHNKLLPSSLKSVNDISMKSENSVAFGGFGNVHDEFYQGN